MRVVQTLLLALRFIKLALIHPEWQGVLDRPRQELQKLAQASRGFGVDSGLGGYSKQEGNKKTSVTAAKAEGPSPASCTGEGELHTDRVEEGDPEEGGLLLDKSLSHTRSMREHCAAMLVRLVPCVHVAVQRSCDRERDYPGLFCRRPHWSSA